MAPAKFGVNKPQGNMFAHLDLADRDMTKEEIAMGMGMDIAHDATDEDTSDRSTLPESPKTEPDVNPGEFIEAKRRKKRRSKKTKEQKLATRKLEDIVDNEADYVQDEDEVGTSGVMEFEARRFKEARRSRIRTEKGRAIRWLCLESEWPDQQAQWDQTMNKAEKARAASRGRPVEEAKIVEPQPDRGF